PPTSSPVPYTTLFRSGAELPDRIPQPGQHVEVLGQRAVAARGVLHQDRHLERRVGGPLEQLAPVVDADLRVGTPWHVPAVHDQRSEEHTSELQSRENL